MHLREESLSMQARETDSRESPSMKMASEPDSSTLMPKDVICSRNSAVHKHPGNQRYMVLIQMRREDYQKAKMRDEKSKITMEVISAVHEYGGRFVKYESKTDSYKVITREAQREKVSHALRSALSPEKRRRSIGVLSSACGSRSSRRRAEQQRAATVAQSPHQTMQPHSFRTPEHQNAIDRIAYSDLSELSSSSSCNSDEDYDESSEPIPLSQAFGGCGGNALSSSYAQHEMVHQSPGVQEGVPFQFNAGIESPSTTFGESSTTLETTETPTETSMEPLSLQTRPSIDSELANDFLRWALMD